MRGYRSWVREHLLPLAFYGFLTIVLTFPLVLRWRTALPGNNHDAWQNYWNFWWTGRALAGGRSPWWTPLLYAPDGAPLYLHTLNFLNGLVTLPIQRFFGLAAAYNAIVFLSFTLAAYCAYLLVARVSGSRLGGLLGGVLYGFSAYHFAHYALGQTNLLASQGLPFFALCLVAAEGARGQRRALLLAAGAATFLLLSLTDWQYALCALLFAAWYGIVRATLARDPAPLVNGLAVALGGLLLAAPLLIATVLQLRERTVPLATATIAQANAADLLSFVCPDSGLRWWRAIVGERAASEAFGRFNRAAYLGVLPPLLGIWGWWAARGRAHFWGLTALAFALLACGPRLQVAGNERPFGLPWPLPLPYALLDGLPGIAIARTPSRFVLLTILALAVLGGLGVARLRERLGAARGGWGRAAALALTAALILEAARVPAPLNPVAPPAFLGYLAAQGAGGTILDLPFYAENPQALRRQTVHGRPMVGGYLSRPLDYPLLALPPFDSVTNRRAAPDIVAGDPPGLALAALRAADVRWIVVDLALIAPGRPRLAPGLEPHVAPEPVYDDGRFAVYRPRDTPAPPDAPLAIRVGRDWYDPEPLPPGERRMRWLRDAATLDLWNLGEGERAATLRFETASFHAPRTLRVSLDGRPLGEFRVAAWQPLALPLTLGPGRHTITLATPDAPTRPVDVGIGADPRPLAIGVTGVTVEP